MILKHVKDVIQGKTSLNKKRSSKWPNVRKKHLEKFPTCAVCSGTKKIEVHHIQPFNQKPELELNFNNLISLCEDKSYGVCCHLFVGHLGNYKNINPNVVNDSKVWNDKLKIKAVPHSDLVDE
jgi:hypothetical protein